MSRRTRKSVHPDRMADHEGAPFATVVCFGITLTSTMCSVL